MYIAAAAAGGVLGAFISWFSIKYSSSLDYTASECVCLSYLLLLQHEYHTAAYIHCIHSSTATVDDSNQRAPKQAPQVTRSSSGDAIKPCRRCQLPMREYRLPGEQRYAAVEQPEKKKKKIEACTRLEMKRRFPPTRRTGRTRRSPRSEASTACMYFHGSFNVYFHDCHVPPLVLWWRYSVLGGSFTTFISPPAKLLVRAQCLYLHVNSKSLYVRRLFMCRSARNDGCPAQTNPIQDPTLTPTLKS